MRIFLPYPPSANERLTVRKGGRGFVNTAKYRAWKKDAAWIVALAIRAGERRIEGHYQITITAMPQHLWQARDIDNIVKAIPDALKSGGAIEDDRFCQRLTIEWGWLDEPGVIVEVDACESLLLRAAGSAKSPSETPKSPTRRQSRRAVTTPAVGAGVSLATAKGDVMAYGSEPSSIRAGITACPKPSKKPEVTRREVGEICSWLGLFGADEEA
jgi:Holliday junction resolvase RusA-like endonuclease